MAMNPYSHFSGICQHAVAYLKKSQNSLASSVLCKLAATKFSNTPPFQIHILPPSYHNCVAVHAETDMALWWVHGQFAGLTKQ